MHLEQGALFFATYITILLQSCNHLNLMNSPYSADRARCAPSSISKFNVHIIEVFMMSCHSKRKARQGTNHIIHVQCSSLCYGTISEAAFFLTNFNFDYYYFLLFRCVQSRIASIAYRVYLMNKRLWIWCFEFTELSCSHSHLLFFQVLLLQKIKNAMNLKKHSSWILVSMHFEMNGIIRKISKTTSEKPEKKKKEMKKNQNQSFAPLHLHHIAQSTEHRVWITN